MILAAPPALEPLPVTLALPPVDGDVDVGAVARKSCRGRGTKSAHAVGASGLASRRTGPIDQLDRFLQQRDPPLLVKTPLMRSGARS
jgi:hypothetical protein